MDRYSEVEVKFEASGITPRDLQEFLDTTPLEYQIENYRHAVGTDYFYSLGTGTLRFRKDSVRMLRHQNADGTARLDPTFVTSCMTVKQRKSADSILDRKEVDLWVGPQEEADVAAMVHLLGGNPLFSIKKEYNVWMLKRGKVHVCFALYDVSRPDGSEARRFLEVEIEKESTCSMFEGGVALRAWVQVLQKMFGVGEPLNASLFELYGKV